VTQETLEMVKKEAPQKTSWTPDEDQALVQAINHYGITMETNGKVLQRRFQRRPKSSVSRDS